MYERAYQSLRETQPDAKEEAVMLLEAWRAFEAEAESHAEAQRATAIAAVEKRMPKRVKRKVCLRLKDTLFLVMVGAALPSDVMTHAVDIIAVNKLWALGVVNADLFCFVLLQRPIITEDGTEAGMEEYFDYIFPDEAAAAPNLKLLEAAQRWKRQKVMQNGGDT